MSHLESNNQPSDGRGEMSAGRLHLELLGTFRLRQGDQPVAGFEHMRLQHLLAYLALYRAAPISRQQLAFLFWPDSTNQQAFKNLRTLLTRLRRALPDADHFISVTDKTIQWRPYAPFTLDVAGVVVVSNNMQAIFGPKAEGYKNEMDISLRKSVTGGIDGRYQ